MQAFKRVMELTCTGKEEGLKWLSNLILSNDFRILAIKFLAILAITNFSNSSKNVRNIIPTVIFYKK